MTVQCFFCWGEGDHDLNDCDCHDTTSQIMHDLVCIHVRCLALPCSVTPITFIDNPSTLWMLGVLITLSFYIIFLLYCHFIILIKHGLSHFVDLYMAGYAITPAFVVCGLWLLTGLERSYRVDCNCSNQPCNQGS